jgi:peptidoglycan/xylan/chitin deacetylase (PgdA/CDA1 family)
LSLFGRRASRPYRSVLTPVERLTARKRSERRRRRVTAAVFVLVVVVALAVLAAIVLGSNSSGRHHAPPPPHTQPKVAAPSLPRRLTMREQRERAVARLAAVGRPVFCGAPRGRALALTFDDGPGPYTAEVLAILRRRHAHATFFLVGSRLRDWPALPSEEALHDAVGDHTWDHADLKRMPRNRALVEIDRTRRAIEQAAGAPVSLFRPPYGDLPAGLGRELRARHLLDVRWSADSLDYVPGMTPQRLVRRLLPNLKPGTIVILHDIHPVTVRALPLLLDAIEKRRLRAVSIPELMRYDPPTRAQLRADERGKACVD